jgi:hypothetical protein
MSKGRNNKMNLHIESFHIATPCIKNHIAIYPINTYLLKCIKDCNDCLYPLPLTRIYL